ncbi:site-specific integrase [Actinomadura sp. 7K507]|nr:site-specific integrase [Actinomadura sp. 7K507]
MAAVRPEFRADELVFDAADPVFGGQVCRVKGCGRTSRGHGLCQGHRNRWAKQGRPDLETFVATTGPRWRKHAPLMCCLASGCGRGVARQGMCTRHAAAWESAGQPPREPWLAGVPATSTPPGQPICMIGACRLWSERGIAFCRGHGNTWKANGYPEPEAFAAGYADNDPVPGHERIHLHDLPAQLKLEIQYALQCRWDERTVKAQPMVVMQVVRFLTDCPESSLLDRPEDQWRTRIGRPAPKDSNRRALLIYARRKLEDLADADGGWEIEYGRDVWRMHNLGFQGRATLRFDRIPQPWLKEPAKRWVRWRISTGLCLDAGRRAVRAIERFAIFLGAPAVDVDRLAEVNRPLLERYLADLHAEMAGSHRHGSDIGLLNSFFTAIRQHGWDDTLPPTAMLFPEDMPKRAERPPRALAEHVMAQVEHPDNLERWSNPAYRLITLILIRCGLRISDALRLDRDCITLDADGAPYLRYFNHKMKREALVPIDEQLHELIGRQHKQIQERWPDGTPWLFPRPTKNLDGQAPTSSSTYRMALYRWLERCDVQDEHGQSVHFTPHQWRHTLGTRMINRDVPQEVVRRILDHDSAEMTGHYARLHDTTVRRHWEQARKVNITGQAVTLDPSGPLAEAAWAKQRLGRVTQALPNGYCGLPVQKTCPHANACLTCPMFVTTPEFMPQHQQHREQIVQIISAAEARGQTRLAEMNQQVLTNLDNIITGLQTDDDRDDEGPEAADAG